MTPALLRRALPTTAALLVLLATPASAGPTRWYPDPPSGTEAAPLEAGGELEEANWVPFLGDHELWCTNGNPGYAGCRNHHGYPAIDFGMPVGSDVRAAGPGRVLFAGSAGDARGRYVELRHPDGVRSRYYHLSATRVRAGQQVHRGQLIGLSGRSGRASSPHLHYEERRANGNLKDPGVMFAVTGNRLVAYRGWNRLPYGTRIRNRAFAVDNTTLYWGGPGVATGDLDGDGADDLVVGVPGEDTQGAIDAGAATVLYGGAAGVRGAGSEEIVQGRNGVPGTREGNEVLGAAVATGDFDGDGFDDVALGAPAATVGGARAAGEVLVLHGGEAGLLPGPRGSVLAGWRSEPGDQFGAALATGDFDGDGFDDLAVGVPGEDRPGAPVSGAVTVFRGGAGGLATPGRELSADTAAVVADAEGGDRMGVALAAGDVNGDGVDDLAVGVPGEDTRGGDGRSQGDAGAVLVLRGRPAESATPGLRGPGSVELHLDVRGVAGDGRPGDQLGTTLAVGDLDGDGFADIVAGAVGKDVGGKVDAGSVLVLRGSASGVRTGGSRHLHADTPGVAGVAQAGDHLGSGLAIGDTTGDERPDLVVGIAGQAARGGRAAGAVLVLPRGAPAGSGERRVQAEGGDALGASVAVGYLDGDGRADVVAGVPGEDVGAGPARVVDAGAVVVLYAGRTRVLHADTGPPAVAGAAERQDRFGGLFPIYLR